MSSGCVGVTIGSSKLTNTNDSQQVTNVGSTVGSVQGDVKISSGKTYTQTGSDVLTPQGDIDITAQQVDITNATDTYANQQTMKYKQSGLTLAITSPVISAIQTAQQMSKAAGKTDDTRMQALAAGTAALAANNAKDAIIAGNTPQLDENGLQVLDANGKNTAENPANQVGGVNLSLSIGSSKSSSQTEQTNTTVKSSTVNAGGDVTITATGDGSNNPDTGNINVIGSTIKAANDVTLKADDKINLLAAQNVDTLNSKNKGSSASLGISIGSSGLLVTASASGSKGKTKGNGSTWTETQIQSGHNTGDKVILESGGSTALKGAQVTGNQVVADVGTSGQGNLNIESLQDTNQYKDKQQSIGGSISVGYGVVGGSISYSDSKTKSNYQSVNEQSGVLAGDGGFQVNVNGNTDLKGAVIASTDKAIQDNKNSLTTQTLTTSNIENSAEYSAKGVSFGTGVGLNKQSDDSYKNAPTASAGSANLSDDSSSVTVSGISGGSVSITDNTQQQTLSGKDTTTTVATLNRDVQTKLTTGTDAQGNTVTTAIAVDSKGNDLAGTLTPIFDQEQVQRELNAQIQITQAFSQVAPKAVADFATNKVKELVVKAQEAHLAGDEATANQLLNEAEKWNEGGAYRIALHTALGGLLTGDISGAAGAGAVAGAAPLLNELQSKTSESLQAAGLGKEGANTVSQALAELTSMGIGSTIGGTAGAGTALVVDTNNRQLHSIEIDLIKKRARDFAKLMRGDGKEPSAEEVKIAEERLMAQAQRFVDATISDYKVDSPAISFLQNVVARDAITANSGRDPVFVSADGNWNTLFAANPNDFFNPNVYKDQGDPTKRVQAYQEIIKVFSNPDAVGETDPSRYLASYLDYANMSKMANQVGKDGALCLTGAGCLVVNAKNFIDGVEALKNGDTKVGWAMIGLSLVGGGASATMLKSEVTAIQNAVAKNVMVRELQAQGVKISPDDVLAMSRLPDGKIIWLEQGSSKIVNGKEQGAGLEHILKHAENFEKKGIFADDLPKLLMQTINEGKIVGTTGASTNVYETTFNGVKQYVAIRVGSNGYVVSANPISSWKALK